MAHPTSPDELAAWKRTARAELRRSRRWLLALVEGLTENEGDWAPSEHGAASAKSRAQRVATHERERLGLLLPEMTPEGEVAAGAATWASTLEALGQSRRLTEVLLDAAGRAGRLAPALLDIVNAEYAEARFIRRIRLDLGKPDVVEPSSALLACDTDCQAAPRFHLTAWTVPRPAPPRAASVTSLVGHKARRAAEALRVGQALAASGDYRGALRSFEESAALCRTADALTYQGWMRSLLGDDDGAEQLCRNAIEIDPEFGNPYNDLGALALRRQDHAAAIAWFERAKQARRYEPRHFPYLNLARLHAGLGDHQRALQELEGALAHAPGDPEVRHVVDDLRRRLGLRDRGEA